jgi:DNA-binding response OmpR family regulator
MLTQELISLSHKAPGAAAKTTRQACLAPRGLSSTDTRAEIKSALLVSPSEDHQFLSQLLLEQDWKLHSSRTLGSALAMLREQQIPVVITERDLPLGDWKDLLAATQQLPYNPLLVVASRHADEYLWAEALNLGAHDVVAKPFQAAELNWVLQSAWRIWSNGKQQR